MGWPFREVGLGQGFEGSIINSCNLNSVWLGANLARHKGLGFYIVRLRNLLFLQPFTLPKSAAQGGVVNNIARPEDWMGKSRTPSCSIKSVGTLDRIHQADT